MGIGRLQWRHLNGTNARRSRISAQALITPPMGRILIALPDASRRVMKEHERIVLPTKEGYDRWSETYEEDDNPLILLEDSHVAPVLRQAPTLSLIALISSSMRPRVVSLTALIRSSMRLSVIELMALIRSSMRLSVS